MLGISRIAVFKKVKKGRLAAIRFGRNWAVKLVDIEAARTAPRLKPGRKPAGAGDAGPVYRREEPRAEETSGAANEMDSMGWD